MYQYFNVNVSLSILIQNGLISLLFLISMLCISSETSQMKSPNQITACVKVTEQSGTVSI